MKTGMYPIMIQVLSFFKLTFDTNFQVNVEIVLVIMDQVREWLGVLWVVVHQEWLECIHGHHPRGDGGAKVLGQEWTQWHVLPLLYVTSYQCQFSNECPVVSIMV